jgi:transmembrane sensor
MDKTPLQIAASTVLVSVAYLCVGMLFGWVPSLSQWLAFKANTSGNQSIGHPNIAEPNPPPPADPVISGSFSTRPGEYRCRKLPDETQACLNSKSTIRYTFNRDSRKIELVSGEASFVVRKDERRPFEVRSGSALIQDLSTSFDVYKKRRSIQVTVIDGRIRIVSPVNGDSRLQSGVARVDIPRKTARELHRLQQMEIDEATGKLRVLPSLTKQRLSQLLAWHGGLIDLNGTTLREALEEFSRYQPIRRFSYSDKLLSEIRVGGIMGFTHLDDFLSSLERGFDIHHTITTIDGNTVVILSRQRHENDRAVKT